MGVSRKINELTHYNEIVNVWSAFADFFSSQFKSRNSKESKYQIRIYIKIDKDDHLFKKHKNIFAEKYFIIMDL